MAEEKFVLGVALDGVVADFDAGLRPIAAEWLGVAEWSLPLPVSRDLSEWHLAGPEGDRAGAYAGLLQWAILRANLFADLEPVDEAPAALRRLAALDSVRVRILMDRILPAQLCRHAFRQVADWLERYRVPYFDVCFIQDKAALAAHLYVESSAESAMALRAAGRDAVVLATRTNRRKKVPHVTSWSRLERLLEKKLAQWAVQTESRHGLRRVVLEHDLPRARRDSSA